MRKQPPTTEEITLEFDGKTHRAHFSVISGIVTVNSFYGSASTQIGGSSAGTIAKILFREILHGAKSRKEI